MLNSEHRIFGQSECTLLLFGKEIRGRQVILPLPPSENTRLQVDVGAVQNFLSAYYANSQTRRRGLLHNSNHYSRWMQAAATLLRKGKFEPYREKVCVLLTVVFPDNRIRDAQNREKALFDAMQKSTCLIDNDVNISFHVTDRRLVRGKGFILAYVFPRSELPANPFSVSDEQLEQIAQQVPDY